MEEGCAAIDEALGGSAKKCHDGDQAVDEAAEEKAQEQEKEHNGHTANGESLNVVEEKEQQKPNLEKEDEEVLKLNGDQAGNISETHAEVNGGGLHEKSNGQKELLES